MQPKAFLSEHVEHLSRGPLAGLGSAGTTGVVVASALLAIKVVRSLLARQEHLEVAVPHVPTPSAWQPHAPTFPRDRPS
jgi:hypothetical protein